jgi:deoxyribodipyrimidine photo-lyase
MLKHKSSSFHKHGYNQAELPDLSTEFSIAQEWMNGKTKSAFINAGMKELNTTGWLSNRMRQNVASYLINEMGCDWRIGAAYFEYKLLDYDVCSNTGNWLYLSGYGNDPRGRRAFNTHRQQQEYDPNQDYVQHWIMQKAGL